MDSKDSKALSGAGGSLVKFPCGCCPGLDQFEAGKLVSILLESLLCPQWHLVLHLEHLNSCLDLWTLEKIYSFLIDFHLQETQNSQSQS